MSATMTRIRHWSGALALSGSLAVAGGCATAASYTPEQEAQMGAQYAAEINQQLPVVQNSAVHSYINQLGNSIARRVDQRGLDYTFYVVNSDEVNAFAIPGGHIYLNRGLIARTDNLSELAGVIGHEIGHVVERHGLEQMARMQNTEMGANLAYILLGRQPGTLEQVGLQLGAEAFFASHSREAEREADLQAIEYMLQSGIDPRGIVTMFETLIEARGNVSGGGVEAWFSTHPLTEDRIEYVRAALQQIPSSRLQGLSTSSPDFQEFRQRVAQLPAAPASE